MVRSEVLSFALRRGATIRMRASCLSFQKFKGPSGFSLIFPDFLLQFCSRCKCSNLSSDTRISASEWRYSGFSNRARRNRDSGRDSDGADAQSWISDKGIDDMSRVCQFALRATSQDFRKNSQGSSEGSSCYQYRRNKVKATNRGSSVLISRFPNLKSNSVEHSSSLTIDGICYVIDTGMVRFSA